MALLTIGCKVTLCVGGNIAAPKTLVVGMLYKVLTIDGKQI
jgi:hypothetical protein